MVLCIFFALTLIFPFWLSSALPSNEKSYLSSPWSNDNSIIDTINYGDGSFARLILSTNSSNPEIPVFACGFICTGTSDAYFLAVVILGEINTSATDPQGGFPGLVWLADRDNPIKENGTLTLTSDGDLVLRDSDGTKVWSTDTSGKSIIGIILQDDGNLQLYSENYTVWESFDHPTDTLLPGQKLYEGRQLISSSSAKNWSRGRYYAEMTSSGFDAFVEADAQLKYVKLMPGPYLSGRSTPIPYVALNPNQPIHHTRGCLYTRSCRPIYESRPTTYAALDGENLALTTGKTNYSIRICPDSADGSYHYLRLGFDGHMRSYRWQKNGVLKEVYDFVVQTWDDCQYPHDCGDYGVCRGGGNCSCLKALNRLDYFKRNGGPLPKQGCSEITPLSCQSPLDHHDLVDFGNLSYFNFIDSGAAVQKLKDLEGCKQACLKNCTCKAAFFKYGSNTSDGDCYLPSKILSMRANPIPGDEDYNSSAFIKIQRPYLAPTPQPVNSPVTEISPIVNSRSKVPLAAIISGSVALLVVFILSAICIFISRKKKKNKKEREDDEEYFKQVPGLPRRFSYEDLRFATDDFSEKLGGGGFGSVFKGILEDGTKIAVKQLEKIGQGMKEFLAEVETISNIHHFNLVQLIGFCAERSHRLLVYEYMSNGSLDHWIFNRNMNLVPDWQTRKKIILDIAKGLTYLHEDCRQRIVHLDIKPQNILLDENFNAKISDFGLSKLMDRDQSQVQTTMRGTPGYLAPEWQQLRITLKVDIYSFGIVLLEIVCGRKNLDSSRLEPSKHLLRLLQEKAEENRLIDIIDGTSANMELHREEAMKMIKLAAWCLQDDHTRRPLMSMVVKVLDGAMEVEPEISYRFCNAMAHNPTTRADFHVFSDPPEASVLSAPR